MAELWIPEYADELLQVSLDPIQSGESEIEGMMILNQAAIDYAAGKLDQGTYCDILEHFGFDPLEVLQEVEDYIDMIGRSILRGG